MLPLSVFLLLSENILLLMSFPAYIASLSTGWRRPRWRCAVGVGFQRTAVNWREEVNWYPQGGWSVLIDIHILFDLIMMTPYLCCKTGQLIERKAHHSRSCRLSAVWRIAPGGGTWRENSCRRVPKICRRLAPSISTSLNYMRCSTQPHTFCSDGDD